jgi:membrane fusion protein, heavy metal efflux system
MKLPFVLLLTLVVATGCSRNGDSGAQSSSTSTPTPTSGPSQPNAATAKTIAVSPSQQKLAGITLAAVEARTTPRTLTVPAQVMMDEAQTAHVAPYTDGQVIDILKMPGDVVHRGEVLAHLHSHAIHETVGALAQNFANLEREKAAVLYAQQKRDRYNHLYQIQAASLEQEQMSQQDLLQEQTNLKDAQAAVIMEREHLADLLAVPPESITPANLYHYELVPLVSPISGTIITRSINPGMVLQSGTEAFTVSNLDKVFVMAAVNETELPYLHTGEPVVVRSDAWPGQTFAGTVKLIGSTLDPATRTLQVRALLPNPKQALKPQMFVTATIDESAASPASNPQAIFIPEDAIQEVNGVQVVFVTEDGTHFAARAIQTQPPVNGQVEVTQGLEPGERIAVAGSFMLKSDLLKGSIEEE